MKTKFILNDFVLDGNRITVTKEVTVDPEATSTTSKFIIRTNKNGNGTKKVYTDPQEVLNAFAELIKG